MAVRRSTLYTRRWNTFRPQLLNLEARLNPSQFLVSSTADNGDNDLPIPGSLRQAIKFINAGTDGYSDIAFGVPPGSVITPMGTLPTITRSNCYIIAAPPTGGVGVRIDGASAFGTPGLWVFGSNVLLQGLCITGFSEAIRLEGNNNNVRSCFIGVDYDGTTAKANGAGITINGDGNTIGGGTPGYGNVISGNSSVGVEIKSNPTGAITADNNKIFGNRIGVNFNFSVTVPNGTHGVRIDRGSGNLVGADDAGDGMLDGQATAANVIQGNKGYGVDVIGSSAKSTKIQANVIVGNELDGIHATNVIGLLIGGTTAKAGNVIGVNKGDGVKLDGDGSLAPTDLGATIQQNRIGVDQNDNMLPNIKNGIALFFSANNTIGGTTAVAANILSGNVQSGIAISGAAAKGNVVQGNKIGTKADGVTAQGNKLEGIYISSGANNNTIGGPSVAAGNIIAFNGDLAGLKGHGVELTFDAGSGNMISRNSIFSNKGRGIDLNSDWVTINDNLTFNPNPPYNAIADADSGPNGLQNYPMVIGRPNTNTLDEGVHTWKLSGTPGEIYTVDLYSNPGLTLGEYAEGATYITSFVTAAVGTDGTVTFTFDHTGYRDVTAVAIDKNGNSSEFSMVDTDADGLADPWEWDDGLDIDQNGTLSTNEFILTGSSLFKKDLYVEVDAMVGFAPGTAIFDGATETKDGGVIKAFAAATNVNVHNPDKSNGVVLHVVYDEKNIAAEAFAKIDDPFPRFQQIKNGTAGSGLDGRFGTPAQRGDANWVQIRQALTLTHRYSMFAQTYSYYSRDNLGNVRLDKAGNPIVLSGSSGLGELHGNDFMVTFGNAGWGNMAPALNDVDRAATWMHELGHTLGLGHGGAIDDNTNYKPNYHSVMNYSWQIPNFRNRFNVVTADYSGSWRLDYSGEQLAALNEAKLVEADGITGGNPAFSVPYGGGANVALAGSNGADVDWNFAAGIQGGTVQADINFSGGNTDVLVGHNDWANLRYYFLERASFAAGHSEVPDGHEDATQFFLPRVASVQINDGSAQRSRITSVTVTFTSPVSLPVNPATAFKLQRQSDGLFVDLAGVANISSTAVTLTFSGPITDFTSLKDGRYTLTVLDYQVTNGFGILDGDNDNTSGGNYVLASAPAAALPDPYLPPTNIFRLFGDATGDGAVSGADFNLFRTAFGGSDMTFDFDNDGFVGNSDFNQFKSRFGASI